MLRKLISTKRGAMLYKLVLYSLPQLRCLSKVRKSRPCTSPRLIRTGFWFGSVQVHTGSATSGNVITTFWNCLMALKAIEDIYVQMLVLKRARSAAVLLKKVLTDLGSDQILSSKDSGVSPQFCEGDIVVSKVGSNKFQYFLLPDLRCVGIFCIPSSTRSSNSSRVEFLLSRRRDHICSRQKRLWEEHIRQSSPSFLQPIDREHSDRWGKSQRHRCQLVKE